MKIKLALINVNSDGEKNLSRALSNQNTRLINTSMQTQNCTHTVAL